MLRALPILLLLTPFVHAQSSDLIASPPKKVPAVSLLPDGSILQKVMLPRYDKDRNLVGVMRAREMTLIDSERVEGKDVTIDFYDADRVQRGRINLTKAYFNQEKGTLEAKEPVEIHSDRLIAKGQGLVYGFEQGEGFLIGPATTWLKSLPATTMKSRNPTLRATAFLGASLLPLIAAPPPNLTPQEIAAVEADAVSREPVAAIASAETTKELETASNAGDAASKAAGDFLNQASLPPISSSEPVDAKPLDIKPGPNDTVVDCEGGMYFDSDEGVLVYLKNVSVTDPRFTLTGANELKIFFDKKAPEPSKDSAKKLEKESEGKSDAAPAKEFESDKESPKKESKNTGLGIGSEMNFGDVKRIVANGAVVFKQKSVDGKAPIEASGAIFSYNVKKGEIILSGGYPWVKQGDLFSRSNKANQNLRILTSGSFKGEGDWTFGGKLGKPAQ